MKFLGLTEWQQLQNWYYRKNPEQNFSYFESRITEFIEEELQKKRKLKVASQRSMISHVKSVYELNGVTIFPWRRIFSKIRPPEGKEPDREIIAYSMDQIKILFNNSNPTYKALIAFFMSGPRTGGAYQSITAVDRVKYPEKERFLRIQDLKDPLEDLTSNERRDFLLIMPDYGETPVYEMNIYSEDLNKQGDPDHYTCWSTPEFYYLINLVLAKRQRDGELDLIDRELKNKSFDIKIWRQNCPDSPVFRAEYGKHDVTSPEPLTDGSIQTYLANRRKDYLQPMKKRVKLFNGFRSYVQTILEHKVTPGGVPLTHNEVQWFMGRELPGMGKHYDRWGKIEQLIRWWNVLEWVIIGEMREKFLNRKLDEKDKTIKQKEAEKQQQWAAFSGLTALTKQALQEVRNVQKQVTPEMSVEMFKIFKDIFNTRTNCRSSETFCRKNAQQ